MVNGAKTLIFAKEFNFFELKLPGAPGIPQGGNPWDHGWALEAHGTQFAYMLR